MESFEIERPYEKFPINNNNEPNLTINEKNKIVEWKKCDLFSKNIKYTLLIEYQTDSFIYFYLKQDDEKIEEFYMKKYESNVVKELLDLEKTYDNIQKIFDLFVDLLDKDKIKLERDESRKEMLLVFKREGNFYGDSDYHIRLFKKENEGNKVFHTLLSEINGNKEKDKNKDSNNNIKENKEFESKIKQIEEANKLLSKYINMNNNQINDPNQINIINQIKNLGNNINELRLETIEENKIKNNLLKNLNIPKGEELNNFTGNPEKLRLDYYLVTNLSSSEDELNNFDVFVGVKDHNYYLIYGNLKNNNIEILNIFDKNIIKSLAGHYMRTSVIKYYLNSIDEEYILSCDINSKAIIWDVANDYSIKYILRMSDTGIIKDAILLFGINKKNYLVISRNNKIEFTKLYELTKDTPYIRDIYNSFKNITYKIIPWNFKNDYYIIELCKGFISVKHLLEDKTYINFKLEKDDIYLSGFIYQNSQLVVNISNKKAITIIDLISKTQKNYIYYKFSCNSLCYWNDKYTLILGNCIEIFDFEKQECEGKRIEVSNALLGVKKIKNEFFGEALVAVDDKKNIGLYSLFDK